MNRSTEPVRTGSQLLDLQLAMMKEAMNMMASGTQRWLQLSLSAAVSSTRDSLKAAGELGVAEPAPRLASMAELTAASIKRAASYGSQLSDLRLANTARLASASKDYSARLQEDVDSILHAFAMAPVAADRILRATAVRRDGPADVGPETRPPQRAKRTAKRHSPRPAREHAR